jgi:hypothetical protein
MHASSIITRMMCIGGKWQLGIGAMVGWDACLLGILKDVLLQEMERGAVEDLVPRDCFVLLMKGLIGRPRLT